MHGSFDLGDKITAFGGMAQIVLVHLHLLLLLPA
jgi:hypothetical protein